MKCLLSSLSFWKDDFVIYNILAFILLILVLPFILFKAFLSDQCKEIEENNRIGKTRDLFKKIRDMNMNKTCLQRTYRFVGQEITLVK